MSWHFFLSASHHRRPTPNTVFATSLTDCYPIGSRKVFAQYSLHYPPLTRRAVPGTTLAVELWYLDSLPSTLSLTSFSLLGRSTSPSINRIRTLGAKEERIDRWGVFCGDDACRPMHNNEPGLAPNSHRTQNGLLATQIIFGGHNVSVVSPTPHLTLLPVFPQTAPLTCPRLLSGLMVQKLFLKPVYTNGVRSQ